MVELHQIAAAVYLAAGIGSLLGLVLPAPPMSRGSAWGLALGALLQGIAFATLHRLDPTPSLTSLPVAVEFMAWVAVLFLLFLMWRVRLPGLVAVVGPLAFLSVFVAGLRVPHSTATEIGGGSAWPHAHVLLASAGLALLCIAGVVGLLYLIEHRRLKAKRTLPARPPLPTLEALDRVNIVALAAGFPLLSLGVGTGMLWQQAALGVFWSGRPHEIWCAIAWAIYAGLVAVRFGGHQGARQAAASAVAGFVFLVFAVVGVGILA